MFFKKLYKIGSIEVLSFCNQDNSFGIDIIPSIGAVVKSLKLNGRNIIDGPINTQEITENNAYKSTFLAPFPNRIKDGIYHFNGKKYQLPINEKPLNNALHGLIYKAPFHLVKEILGRDQMEITLNNEYDGKESGYPFPFTSQVKITIDLKQGFTCQLSFTNNSEASIPFGYGWHPYFQLNGKADSWELQFPVARQFKVDKQMIPVGESKESAQFASLTSLQGINLDDCFEIIQKGAIQKTILKNDDGSGITLWQETGDKKLNFLQIYIPPHRDSIAIEPQSSCIDAFNNGIGLFNIASNETIQSSFGIGFLI